MSSRATYVCCHCLFSQKVNVSENQCLIRTGSDDNDETEVLNTENELKWTNLSQNVKSKLCEFSNISQEYKNVVLLKSTKCPIWLSERNNLLVSFLKGATGICGKDETDKKLNALTHTVEQVYYDWNLNIITPFAFKRNLVTFSLTHSKLAVKLYGKWESSRSYSTLSEILLQPGEPLTCKMNSDALIIPSTIIKRSVNVEDESKKVGKYQLASALPLVISM